MMLFFALFLPCANAAAIFTNSTSASTTLPSSPSLQVAAITPTPTPFECNIDNGQNCLRLPEQPFYNYITPGVINYEYNHQPFDSPWMYQTEMSDPAAASSRTSCDAYFYDLLSQYKANSPLTQLAVVPEVTYTWVEGPGTELWHDFSLISSSTRTTTGIGGVGWTYTAVVTDLISTEIILSSTFASTHTILHIDAAYTPFRYISDFTFSATSPCCYSCTLFGGDIQVLYWPTATANTNLTASTVNSAGLTMVSPSVYLAIQHLSASDYCGPVSAAQTPVTVGFNASALSTAQAYRWDTKLYTTMPDDFFSMLYPQDDGGFTQATWGVSQVCEDITTEVFATITSSGTALSAIVTLTSAYTFTYNPCSPILSVPYLSHDPGFNSLDPLFTRCFVDNIVLSDPPYALSTAGPIVAPITIAPTAEAITTSTTSAAAGQTIQPIATSTTAIAAVLPTSTGTASQSSTIVPLSTSTTSSQDPNSVPAKDPSTTSQAAAVDPNNSADSSSSTAAQNTFIATLGSTTITANSASQLVIASQTLTPGGQITVTGSSATTTISLASNGQTLNIDGTTTQVLQPVSTTPVVVIGTQTLSAGGPAITVSGTVLSLQAGGTSVVIGGTTQALSILAGITTLSAYVVGTQTLSAGGAAVTLSGTVISLQNGGASVIIGGTTQPVSALLQNVLATTPIYVIGTQTLSAGGPAITVSGTILSLQSGGSNIVVGGSSTQAVSVLVGSHVLTPEYVIASQTLVAGGAAITVLGVTLSLLSSGSSVLVGSKTEGVSFLAGGSLSTTSVGLGGIIATIGGFAGMESATTTTSSKLSTSTGNQTGKAAPAAYTGGADRSRGDLGLGVGIWLGIVGAVMYCQ